MTSYLPPTLRGVITLLLITLNTLFWAVPIHILALTKLLIRNNAWQKTCARAIMFFADGWITGINTIIRKTQGTVYDIEGLEGLSKRQWYFINCNHQSWADILVLFMTFHGSVPFLKFFLKKELFRVPVMGTAWWALDYPFMKRYSKSYLEKNPHMKGKDLETTRKVCERYRHSPVAILNFIEGTRFTKHKHASQQSPYRHLLRPKAGGFAFALAAMDGKIENILDVTIIYSNQNNSFWDFLCGRIERISVRVKKMPVPHEFLCGDYQKDSMFRDRIQSWVSVLWQDKDELIEQHRNARSGC
ncbi:MAG TPA: acyltransferase [Desulfomonilia bacterium]|nr:acyltransferase [Desulfomonilia bacterium]